MEECENKNASIQARLESLINRCRDPSAVISEMARIELENRGKSNDELADLVYSYLSDRFDTLRWFVLVHSEKKGYCPDKIIVTKDFYIINQDVQNPMIAAISISPDNPSLFDQNALGKLTSQKLYNLIDIGPDKLSFAAMIKGKASFRSNPNTHIVKTTIRDKCTLPGSHTFVASQTVHMEYDVLIFPANNFNQVRNGIHLKNHPIAPWTGYKAIYNRHGKALSVKDDYENDWQWIWQKNYHGGKGQLWTYTTSRQLVNKNGMCLTVSSFGFDNSPKYVYQERCNESNPRQIWDLVNGQIFNAVEGCLQVTDNRPGNKEWLYTTPAACFRWQRGEYWEVHDV